MPDLERLTEREWEVLHLVGQGLTNEQIANRLVITVATVQHHLNSILGKLGVSSRIQAALEAKVIIYTARKRASEKQSSHEPRRGLQQVARRKNR